MGRKKLRRVIAGAVGMVFFTYYLVKGMRGEADADNNKIITINELYEYVRAKVKEDTKSEQVPQLNTIGSDSNFPISVIK